MNKKDIERRIEGLNRVMLENSTKELILLQISPDYTYNKAIALVNKNEGKNNWYAVDDKYCFRTWAEAECYIDGICKGKNTDFQER